MEELDIDEILNEVKFYLGALDEFTEGPNVLPDQILVKIIEGIIQQEENTNDDNLEAKVKCLALRKAATQNKQMAMIDPNRGLRREESNKREIEFFESNPVEFWEEYIQSLPDLCATFGYCGLASNRTGMFKHNVATPIRYPAGSREVASYERTAYSNGRPRYPNDRY